MFSLSRLLASVLSISISVMAREEQAQTITTGRMLGKTIDVGGKKVVAFLGVPFAEAPVGDLRFRAPVAKEPWDDTLDATDYGASCQLPPDLTFGDFKGSDMWNPKVELSEDCLNLNLWVPSPRPTNAAVMIWIYGGSYYSGASSLDIYNGEYLAAEEQVIVVSMNYRVGIFGFLTFGDENAPGNQGLMDQALAFQWVQDNIAGFGGDPNKVTIWGESAGAASVSHHMLSPISRHLFQRGILQSSASTAGWSHVTLEEGIRRSRTTAGFLGCDYNRTSEDIIACLEGKSAEDLLNEQFWVSETFLDFPFVPVIDGTFLPEDPVTAYKNQNFKQAEILLGSNINEAMFFLVYEVPDFVLTTETITASGPLLSREDYAEALKYIFGTTNSFGFDAIYHQYINWLEPDDPVVLRYAVDLAAGDYFFTCSTYDMAKAWASAGNDVYYYRFEELASGSPWPEWVGVLHGDEIAYTFGYPLNSDNGYSEKEKVLSRKIMRYWANFSKYGNPNSPNEDDFNGPEWPLYTQTGQEFLILDEDINMDIAKTGRGPRANQCAFWREYLPKLDNQTNAIRITEAEWKKEFDGWRAAYITNWKNEFDGNVTSEGVCLLLCQYPPFISILFLSLVSSFLISRSSFR